MLLILSIMLILSQPFSLENSRDEPEKIRREAATMIGNSYSLFIIQLNNQPVTDSQWRKVVEAEYLV
jgi:hypothetical protein